MIREFKKREIENKIGVVGYFNKKNTLVFKIPFYHYSIYHMYVGKVMIDDRNGEVRVSVFRGLFISFLIFGFPILIFGFNDSFLFVLLLLIQLFGCLFSYLYVKTILGKIMN